MKFSKEVDLDNQLFEILISERLHPLSPTLSNSHFPLFRILKTKKSHMNKKTINDNAWTISAIFL